MWAWLNRKKRKEREAGQSCESCCFFIDHRDPPDDNLGYCGELVARLGLEAALKQNEYGGHWTDGDDWCERWEGGPRVWQKESEKEG